VILRRKDGATRFSRGARSEETTVVTSLVRNPPDRRPDVVETHTAFLFFVGDRVYKFKKSVVLPFVDFSTREARESACRAEVALNGRLSPDVYLGVGTVLDPEGEPCDYFVIMRRMPEERRLSTLLPETEASDCVRSIARAVARFHASTQTSPLIGDAGSSKSVTDAWAKNMAELRPYEAAMLPIGLVAEADHLGRRFVEGREHLLRSRVAAGKVRDGHGDLLADDIFCLPDGPRILDCIDFDARLRYGDVVADAAFLAMDLERLGYPHLAAQFLDDYRRFSGEAFPESLAHFYIAHRALVRAKVTCIAVQQGIKLDTGDAARLARIALYHLNIGRVRVVLVGGLPGTGKSTLTGLIGPEEGWAVLSSDEVRKDIVGIPHDRPAPAPFREGIYSPAVTEATYLELLGRARQLVTTGQTVVIDASWTDQRWRIAAAALADETQSDLVQLMCVVPRDVADDRLLARAQRVTVSDATPGVAARMAAEADEWTNATLIDGTASPKQMLHAALQTITGPSDERAQDVQLDLRDEKLVG
jgi:uncharacterized protein